MAWLLDGYLWIFTFPSPFNRNALVSPGIQSRVNKLALGEILGPFCKNLQGCSHHFAGPWGDIGPTHPFSYLCWNLVFLFKSSVTPGNMSFKLFQFSYRPNLRVQNHNMVLKVSYRPAHCGGKKKTHSNYYLARKETQVQAMGLKTQVILIAGGQVRLGTWSYLAGLVRLTRLSNLPHRVTRVN